MQSAMEICDDSNGSSENILVHEEWKKCDRRSEASHEVSIHFAVDGHENVDANGPSNPEIVVPIQIKVEVQQLRYEPPEQLIVE